MEKNRIRPVVNGKSSRMSYSRQKEVLEMPNLIEVQKDSYEWFLNEGLKEAFDDISPITNFGGDLRRFPEIALGVDLRRVGVRVSEDDLRRFEAEPRSDLRRRQAAELIRRLRRDARFLGGPLDRFRVR